ncbi:MAG: TolC family protein [Alistipes senegalensis]|nr:TolC family protein [Bacteroides cellulosilyticus]MCM1351947.1 TolC family protein [Alistipes senegalensis]
MTLIKLRIILTAVVFLGTFVVPATAQTPLTLDQCVEQAKANNRRLAAADKQVQAARYDLRSMKANFLPSISAVGMGLYSNTKGGLNVAGGMLPVVGADMTPTGQFAAFPGMNIDYRIGWLYGGGVQLEQPLYMGGKVRTGLRMAKIGTELAAQNRRLTEQEVVLETSRAYADVVRARELRKVAERYHALLTELLRNVESARKHGLKPQNDVLRVQVKLNESELSLRRAENGLRLATMNLAHLTGHRLTEPLEITGDLPDYPAVAPAADLEGRPEFRLLDRKSQLAREQVRLARSERLPQVGLVGSYGYTHGVKLNDDYLLDGASYMAGVQVSIPIFHFGGRSAKMRAARAKYEQAQLEQADGSERMQLELTRAANNFDESALEVRLAESSLAAADENLRLSGLQYRNGTATLSDYLEAQALWQQAYQTHVQARVDGYLDWLEYSKAAGRL